MPTRSFVLRSASVWAVLVLLCAATSCTSRAKTSSTAASKKAAQDCAGCKRMCEVAAKSKDSARTEECKANCDRTSCR